MFRGHIRSHNSKDILRKEVHGHMLNGQDGKPMDFFFFFFYTCSRALLHTFKYSLTVKAQPVKVNEKYLSAVANPKLFRPISPARAAGPTFNRLISPTLTNLVIIFIHTSFCMVQYCGRQPLCELRSQNSTTHPAVIYKPAS